MDISIKDLPRNHKKIIATIEGHEAGYLLFVEPAPGRAQVLDLRVYSDYRRQGVATVLCETVWNRCPEAVWASWTKDGNELWKAFQTKHPEARVDRLNPIRVILAQFKRPRTEG